MNLQDEIKKYRWYHRIEVVPGVFTIPGLTGLSPSWDFIVGELRQIDFVGKSVLDLGCRDGMWSLFAERAGASKIVALDNDLSTGAVDFLLPFFKSKVKMEKMNVMNLSPQSYGEFDIVMAFGLLYHLRYPMFALRRMADCVKLGGIFLIETGVAVDIDQTKPLMYCPVHASPYEPTSCTFFNASGLITTVESFGFRCSRGEIFKRSNNKGICRSFFRFEKVGEMPPFLAAYWDSTHAYHSTGKE